MKIKQIEIRNFGNISNQTLTFSQDINVLYTEKEQTRKEIQAFIESMLFGRTDDVLYAGVIWFESGGNNYRLTRDLYREESYSELLCEESGELLDADRISEDKMALGISEAVYENAICIAPLKGNTGAEIVREVQKQMTGFQSTGDCSVDLGKTSQRIKMARKGYQVQVERRKKADQTAKEKLLSQIKQIRHEIHDLEEQKVQLGVQETTFRMNEESNGYYFLDERIGSLETRKQIQIAAMCVTAFLAIAGAAFLVMEVQTVIPAIFAGIIGILLFMTELSFEMRTVRELEKRKRMKARWLARQSRLEGGKNSLDEEMREKRMELSNLTVELREMEEYAYLPLMEEVEIDALNLAMNTIGKLSDEIYYQKGNRLVRTMSEILRGITGGVCSELTVDDEFHISVDAGEGLVSIENLRLIMVEQIYLAMRLAAGELLGSTERLPIIFDEMFCAFDPERLKDAVSWIVQSGRQVILSTSRKQEIEVIKKSGLTVKEISL